MVKKLLWLGFLGTISCASSGLEVKKQTAQALAQKGRFSQALELYTEYLCAEKEDLAIATAYVETWHQLGANANAEGLEDCLAATETITYIEGLQSAAQKNYSVALEQLSQVTKPKTDANNAELFYRKGLIALQIQNNTLATQELAKAHTHAPARIDITLAYAQNLIENNNIQAAQQKLHALVSMRPSRAEIRMAAEIHNRMIDASYPPLPEDIEKQVREILQKLEAEQLTREVVHQGLALAKHNKHSKVLLAAGLANLRYGLTPKGLELLKEASQLNPFSPHSAHALALYFEENKQLTQALSYYAEAFARDPYNVVYAIKLAQKAEDVGKLDQAIQALTNLQVIAPQNEKYLLALARVHKKQDNFLAAQRFIEEAHSIAPKNIPVVLEWLNIAVNAATSRSLKKKDREAAQRSARKALNALQTLSPNHPATKLFNEKLESIAQTT
ncbi:MAG: hypothetical protein CMH60_02440 [Myxococcales bacterium]|nr:hypothetical protein [Myxococcales bacterium]|tara:strand:+ start:1352 stop:2689 length:1338 start_codon:yes stop_codon:yes gene_type:complete